MNGPSFGIWDLADQSLQWIGKSVSWLMLRRDSKIDEGSLCAATGGALVCGLFGGVVGFALSGSSPNIGAVGGIILGGLLGVCLGICFGVFVETVDSATC